MTYNSEFPSITIIQCVDSECLHSDCFIIFALSGPARFPSPPAATKLGGHSGLQTKPEKTICDGFHNFKHRADTTTLPISLYRSPKKSRLPSRARGFSLRLSGECRVSAGVGPLRPTSSSFNVQHLAGLDRFWIGHVFEDGCDRAAQIFDSLRRMLR